MIILGIDPGIGRTGWGVIQSLKNQKLEVNNFGCFETEPNSNIPERLLKIYKHIHRLIDQYKPDEMGIEELFFTTNAKTAFVVGQARGVVLLASVERNIPISIYTPLQVKIAVTGYGRADKSQVGQMVKTILKLQTVPRPDDTTDALAVAITHSFSSKISKLKTLKNT